MAIEAINSRIPTTASEAAFVSLGAISLIWGLYFSMVAFRLVAADDHSSYTFLPTRGHCDGRIRGRRIQVVFLDGCDCLGHSLNSGTGEKYGGNH